MINTWDDDKAIVGRLMNSLKWKDRQDKNIIIHGSLKIPFDGKKVIKVMKIIKEFQGN